MPDYHRLWAPPPPMPRRFPWIDVTLFVVVVVVIVVTLAAGGAAAQDWIKERERLWEQVEAACGEAALHPSFDEPEEQLRSCMHARAHGREPGTIRLGDTPEYVLSQWGRAQRKQRMVSQYGVAEWWFYGSETAVHFTDGRADTIFGE